MEWRGKYGEVLYGFHIAIVLHNWVLRPDDMDADASVLSIDKAERHPFWGDYPPTSVRLMIGNRWWTYSTVTALSDTLLCVSGIPEVTNT